MSTTPSDHRFSASALAQLAREHEVAVSRLSIEPHTLQFQQFSARSVFALVLRVAPALLTQVVNLASKKGARALYSMPILVVPLSHALISPFRDVPAGRALDDKLKGASVIGTAERSGEQGRSHNVFRKQFSKSLP